LILPLRIARLRHRWGAEVVRYGSLRSDRGNGAVGSEPYLAVFSVPAFRMILG
jgi:hypothetical protein